jgi:hypothetical protein
MSNQSKNKLTQEDLDFLGVERKVDGETIKVKYVKNLEQGVKQQYENIYKRVINPDFVLCFHCSNEVFDMVARLQQLYAEQVSEVPEALPVLESVSEVVLTPVTHVPVVPTHVAPAPVVSRKKYSRGTTKRQ